MIKKICRGCYVPKPLDQFHKNKTFPDGHLNYCKTCANEKKREKEREKKEENQFFI